MFLNYNLSIINTSFRVFKEKFRKFDTILVSQIVLHIKTQITIFVFLNKSYNDMSKAYTRPCIVPTCVDIEGILCSSHRPGETPFVPNTKSVHYDEYEAIEDY